MQLTWHLKILPTQIVRAVARIDEPLRFNGEEKWMTDVLREMEVCTSKGIDLGGD